MPTPVRGRTGPITRSELNLDQLPKNGIGTKCWHSSLWAPADLQPEGFLASSEASKQREALCVGPATLSTPAAVPPARPGAPHPTAPEVLRPSLHAQRCSLGSTAGRVRSAAAPGLSVAEARRRTFSLHLQHPAPFALQEMRMWGFGLKLPATQRFPKTPRPQNKTITPKSLESLLPVFHFCVCVSFPHPLKNPSREGGKNPK